MTTALKYTEDFCEKESNNLFFMSVVDKAKAGGFVLLDRQFILNKRKSFIMTTKMKHRIYSLGRGCSVPHVESLRTK